ncbi:MAG TPA: RidA family protein [Arenicellales bacterium]|jgi:enamine deaminase RidA (YjgF/YER057c/UK114 family)|nr:RidA family protein [Arenicellales bacterium]HJL52726.1 RidA family protein [Arenicellales bacterium]|tara:strand:- start:15722 stop:16120 length:399 start_codon:yes stop_codon:yes gene_type:complete
MEILKPESWRAPQGYSNGIAVDTPGRIVYLAGQVGWDETETFHSEDIAPQFEQALKNILTVLAEAGGKAEDICRITAFCSDKPAYMEARRDLGGIWKRHMGRHYPAMSMIFVSALLDEPGKIELEATAFVPE